MTVGGSTRPGSSGTPYRADVESPSSRTPPRRRAARVLARWGARLAVALAGAVLGVLLAGRVEAPIGPFDATLTLRPTGGAAELVIPPLGSLAVDAYDGPLGLDIHLERLDQQRVTELATEPARRDGVVDRVTADLTDAVVELAWTTAAAALLGAGVASVLVLHGWRESVAAMSVTAVLLAGTASWSVSTWRPQALAQPTYTGLLVDANSLIGDARDVLARFDAYRASLRELVTNVSTLYATLSTLPPPDRMNGSTVLLHVSDLHLNPAGFDLVEQLVDQFPVDAVLDTGDITDWGSEPENAIVERVGALDVPYVFVRGNHDSATTAGLLAAQPDVTVLDGTATTVAGLTVVGTRGPRYTPDGDDPASLASLEQTGEELAGFVRTLPEPPDVALVHDPDQAPPLADAVPLVLAGHTHDREVRDLDGDTRLMVQGSTGGAGLRALQGVYPEPLTATVLYLDPVGGELVAHDEVTLAGLGGSEATIERTVVEPLPDGETARPVPVPSPVPIPAG